MLTFKDDGESLGTEGAECEANIAGQHGGLLQAGLGGSVCSAKPLLRTEVVGACGHEVWQQLYKGK